MSRCKGTTRTGRRCRRDATRGDRCHLHAPAASDGKLGRPRSEAKTELAAAQRDKVDQQAAREVRRIREMLAGSLEAAETGQAFDAMMRVTIDRIRGIRTELAPRVVKAAGTGGDHEVAEVVEESVRALLGDLAGGVTQEARSGPTAKTEARDPVLVVPTSLKRSSTATEARARLNRLQAQRLELQGRLATGKARWSSGWRPWHDPAGAGGLLLPADEVLELLGGRISAARALLLGWPVTLADRLARAAFIGPGPVEALLRTAIGEVVENLTGGELEEEVRPLCGAETKKGPPCQNPSGAGGRCHLHRRQEAAA